MDLKVSHEDLLFKAISAYINGHPKLDKEESVKLWLTCRFAQLSPAFLAEACHTPGIPLQMVTEGAVGKLLAEDSTATAYQAYINSTPHGTYGDSEGVDAQRFMPRNA